MDRAIKFLSIGVAGAIISGMILEYFDVNNATFITGSGVLVLVFVLMPFFLFWRYDRKKHKQN